MAGKESDVSSVRHLETNSMCGANGVDGKRRRETEAERHSEKRKE